MNKKLPYRKLQNNLKKERSVWKSCFGLILVIIIIIIGVILFGSNYYKNIITSVNSDSKDNVSIQVQEGDNLNSLAKTLEEKGVIKSEFILKLYLRSNNISANIKPGTYLVSKNLTIDEVISILETGSQKVAIVVTLRDGLKYEQSADIIDNAFQQQGNGKTVFDKNQFIQICQNPDKFILSIEVKNFLTKYKPIGKPLRGFLFPDTYKFDVDSTSEQVVETMILNFHQRLIDNNVPIDNVTSTQSELKTFYSTLTLASIIQKESGKPADDANISSVFHNRLADNYPLQSDATINFALNNSDPSISVQDTNINSPYNTYKNNGVTPTPIDEPGILAIIAAIKPTDTKYYFFVYDKSSNVYFAKTFAEHQRNIYKHNI